MVILFGMGCTVHIWYHFLLLVGLGLLEILEIGNKDLMTSYDVEMVPWACSANMLGLPPSVLPATTDNLIGPTGYTTVIFAAEMRSNGIERRISL